jgi:hypothetical protein
MFYIKKPAVHQKALILIAGSIWSCVGILLINISFRWVALLSYSELFIAVGIGLVSAIFISIYGFKIIAQKNISRIALLPERACIFAFIKWETYFLIIIMISMGVFLRTSNIIPEIFLVVIYSGIGLALFISSFEYYQVLRKKL